jgi:hypothetical protein
MKKDGERNAFIYLFVARAREGEGSRVARFFLVQNTKMGENIPNGHKLFPMAVK